MPKVKTNTEPPLIVREAGKSIKAVMKALCGKDTTKTVKKPKKGK